MMRTKSLNRLNITNAIGVFIILLAYAQGVFRESFWSDDYPAIMDTQGVVDHLLKDARPTAAALFSPSFSLLNGPANAWILRFLALIALLLIFLFISKRINNSKYSNIGKFAIAIAFCSPSFQMYLHWSTTWFYLWAALAGLYAFHFSSSKLISRRIFAVFLLVLALTTYPPTALFFFSIIAVINVLNESQISKIINEVVRSLVLLAISGLVSILTVLVTMQLAAIFPNRRVRLVTLSEIPDKIIWLFSRPFVIGLRPFMIDSPTAKIALITALPVILILFLGMKRQSQHLGEPIFYRAFWIALPLLITLAPIMITSDNQIEFRVLPGYSWGIAALASYFLLVLIRSWLEPLRMKGELKRVAFLVLPAALSLIGVISINSHYTDLFGGPYQKKNTFLNAKISSCINSGSIKSVLILPPKEPFPSFQRLGVFSMSTDLASGWVPKPNVELLLKQQEINAPVVYLEVRPALKEAATTECVIDLEEFRKLLT